MASEHDPKETLRRIREAQETFPALAERIERGLLIALHTRGIASIDQIHDMARSRAAGSSPREENLNENTALAARLGAPERKAVAEITIELACEHLAPEEVDDLVNLQRKREEAGMLEEIANLSTVSFRLLAEKVKAFAALPRGQTRLPESEVMAVRVALIRHFISDQLEFIGVARNHLTIRDFDELVDRILGDDQGMGRIGGKAAGLLLARCILRRARQEDPAAPEIEIHAPESWYLRSDVIERFLDHQGLYELQSHKYKTIEQIRDEYPLIVDVFKNADFPPEVVAQLRGVIEVAGDDPLIVRSSSLLEDRFGAAFAGKYRSIFLANQGAPDARLDAVLGAIAEVYASTLHPDAISYRRRHNLIDYSENMAILIQKVVGRRYGRYFLPTWAGVAFSRNEYRRNPRLRAEDGIACLVFGLGTRAVDRGSTDSPRVVPLGAPTMRPEVREVDVVRKSQHRIDVVNLEKNRFETMEFSDLIADEWMPGLEETVSIFENGHLRRPPGALFTADPKDLVVTFDHWVADTRHPAALRWILQTLERAYGQPVEIEYAFDGERFHLLQCRPQVLRGKNVPVELPARIEEARKIFTAERDVSGGVVNGIEYIVLVDAEDYDRLGSRARQARIARVIHTLNDRLAGRAFILMGPGRWGTKDPKMGITTGYADINNTRMLIELAQPLGGFIPEVSFGSHFFQDLVESDIHYLALYPEDEGVVYNRSFLCGSPSVLTDLLPEAAEFRDVVRVIHVPAASGGLFLRVVMDGEEGRALGYLTEP